MEPRQGEAWLGSNSATPLGQGEQGPKTATARESLQAALRMKTISRISVPEV